MNCDYNLAGAELLQEIKAVREHWEMLNARLNWSNDVRAIEQLSYEMLADERRYEYLLKLAKETRLHTPKFSSQGDVL